jgi:hypothetical protein
MYWTLYKNVFDKMKLRGVSTKSLCPLLKVCLKFCLREVRSISQSFSDSQDRTMAQEKSILQIVTFDLLVPKCEFLDVFLRLML